MAPPARLLGLAVLAWALAQPLQAGDSASCPESYKHPQYLETWEISRQDWLNGCAEGKKPRDLLAEGQQRFIDDCRRVADQLVKDGRLSHQSLREHCSQGRSGKAKIPGLAQTQARPSPAPARSPSLDQGGKKVAAWEKDVRARLNAGQLPALYSEKAPISGPGSVSAGSIQPVPKPLPEVENLETREPASKPSERASSPPPFEPAPYDEDIEKILGRVVRHEANEESHQQARRVIRVMSTELPATVRKNLAENKIQVEIIPKDKKLTDLPNFKGLKGKKTFDGRLWDDVRGAANMGLTDGGVACAIPEENLLPGGAGYIRFYVLAHEYGHLVLTNGLPLKAPPPGKTRRTAQNPILERLRHLAFLSFSSTMDRTVAARDSPPPGQDEVEKVYVESMKRAEKTGLGAYADTSKGEMFAESSASYFGVNSPVKSAAELKKANADLHSVTERTYGSPRKVSQ